MPHCDRQAEDMPRVPSGKAIFVAQAIAKIGDDVLRERINAREVELLRGLAPVWAGLRPSPAGVGATALHQPNRDTSRLTTLQSGQAVLWMRIQPVFREDARR